MLSEQMSGRMDHRLMLVTRWQVWPGEAQRLPKG